MTVLKNSKKGFTLIELLIVMAILGVLAVVVLVAINPAEQMRRARDTGKISGASQIGHAVQAYYTANGCLPGDAVGVPCPSTAAWDADLTNSEELRNMPSGITTDGNTNCTGGTLEDGTWCYKLTSPDDFVVYSQLASQQRENQCGGADAYGGFSSSGKGGIWCTNEPTAGSEPTY